MMQYIKLKDGTKILPENLRKTFTNIIYSSYLPPSEILEYLEAEIVEEDEPKEIKEANARKQRNLLLVETDWMALNDVSTMSQEWIDYRQALRDISSQENFPDEIVWPVRPNG